MHRSGVINIATISAGFEKSDFLVREEKGHRVFFDFFEEAFNYVRCASNEIWFLPLILYMSQSLHTMLKYLIPSCILIL